MGAMLTGAGLSLGPIMGGYIVERTTWRWIFWACAITFALLAVVGCYILKETYSPVLHKRVYQSGNDSKTEAQAPSATSQTNLDVSSPLKRLSARAIAVFKGPWVRPAQMLIQSPIVLLFAIYTTVTQGYLLLVFATLGLVYQDHYHFSPGASGLAYLGLAGGLTLSQFTLGHLSDKHIARGAHKPEGRLPPLLIGALIIPFSLLAYGWGPHMH
ncbi:MFS general substrate transporter [Bimuria novae-zelandiae CBS 107.79]|uniref:MFS general substrate transporter n=1 Tax=Bimuria novae-zelandiae CBS 107.79 TaxID=1447943 RepID=A0A6A5V280_9PLEO|nr:MFS general substrate transporter [Bimuria novae-zelandiae CBS 107.79]